MIKFLTKKTEAIFRYMLENPEEKLTKDKFTEFGLVDSVKYQWKVTWSRFICETPEGISLTAEGKQELETAMLTIAQKRDYKSSREMMKHLTTQQLLHEIQRRISSMESDLRLQTRLNKL